LTRAPTSILLFFLFLREIASRQAAAAKSEPVESIGRNGRVPAFLMDHYRPGSRDSVESKLFE